MNITTLHGISRYLDGTGSNAVGLGLGINFDFMDKTNITFFYEPRLIYDNFSLFANLGYSLGQEKDLKGFAFASGVGIAPVKVAKRFKLDLDGGYGDKGGKSFYFLRGGIIFL